MDPIDLIGPEHSAGPSSISIRSINIHDVLGQLNVSDFDWQAYEGTYRDRALITRLYHISHMIMSHPLPPTPQSLSLARAALQRLIPILKTTLDASLYLRAASTLADTRNPERLANKSSSTTREPKKEGLGAEDEVMAEHQEGEGEDLSASMTFSEPSGPSAKGEFDMDWVEEAREAERREAARLDVELRGYMSNLIKESIRLTYLAFARLSIKAGRSNDARKHYTSAREYSTSPAHHVDLGLGILEVSLAFNQPDALAGHLSKLEAALDRAYPPPASTSGAGPSGAATAAGRAGGGEAAALTAADVRENREKEARSASVRRSVGVKIRVAKGLEALARREWERAGRELGEVGEEGGLGEWEGHAISTTDIALITALCTLATSKRDRIRRVLLDRTSFRSAVDDSQGWIIDLVRAFMEAKYGEVTAILNRVEPYLLLNPFLSAHSRDIITLIQTRAVVQYVAPFSSVKIEVMARAFEREVESMWGQVERLIKDGQIKGRLDLIDGLIYQVLELHQANPRKELYRDAVQIAHRTTTTSKAALLRMRLHEAGIVVDPRPPSDSLGSHKLTGLRSDSLEMEGIGASGGLGMDEAQFVR